MPNLLRRLLIGRPIATHRAAHEKLPKLLALPVFASDAVSSVAYATGEMMAALLVAGAFAISQYTFGISIGILVLLVIVTTSYRQTVLAYPGGGGAYVVARDNLGILYAQIAGAALLIDYLLTVAVSISSGAAAIRSLVWAMSGGTTEVDTVAVALFGVVAITLLNLRGVRESGKVIAAPVYAFIFLLFALVGMGLWQHFTGTLVLANPTEVFEAAKPRPDALHGTQLVTTVGVFLILHAFASGCAALTGVEAISNGVTSFQQPAGRNAAITMIWMAAIMAISFVGVSYLAVHVQALPETAEGVKLTVVAQIGQSVFGDGVLFAALQIFTALILMLAANTAFAGFPALGAMIARDGFLPRQLSNVGDRLVFDRGILVLAVLAGALIWYKRADVHQLIPLYAVGVFLSFTLSQSGLVRRWLRLRSPGWWWKAAINGFGAVLTLVVTLVFAVVKFTSGAWLVVILLPALVLMFLRIHAHYEYMRAQLSIRDFDPASLVVPKHAVLVLIPSVTKGVLRAMLYARSLAGEVRGIHIETDPERTKRLRDEWMQFLPDVSLVILESPYRSVVEPLLRYLDEVQRERPNTQVTVVVPEFVSNTWWQNLLHGQTGLVLKLALLGRKNVVVTNVRYHLAEEHVSLREMLDVQKDFPNT